MTKPGLPQDDNHPREHNHRELSAPVLTRDPECERLARRMRQVGVERYECLLFFPESDGGPVVYEQVSTDIDGVEVDSPIPSSEAILVLDDFHAALIRAVPSPPPSAPEGPGALTIRVTVFAERRRGGQIVQTFATRCPASGRMQEQAKRSRRAPAKQSKPRSSTSSNKQPGLGAGANTFKRPVLVPSPRKPSPIPPALAHAAPVVMRIRPGFEDLIDESRASCISVMQLMLVYTSRGDSYVCVGNTIKSDGTVVSWRNSTSKNGFAMFFAEELISAFPRPPLDAPRGSGEVIVGVEIRPDDPPGLRVRRTFIDRRVGPPPPSPYSPPLQ